MAIATNLQPTSIQTPSMPTSRPSVEPVGEFEKAWVVYLEARITEWKVIFTLDFVFVGLSLGIFQIPQATTDPLTHTLASLALCRAFAGLMYGVMFYLYFKSEYTHTGRFAKLWWKKVMDTRNVLFNTWVMLSLPAASTLWALLFYFFTILSFTLRPTNSTSDDHEMPLTLAIILQATITTSTLSDLICFVSIWNTLKGHKIKYNTIEGENV